MATTTQGFDQQFTVGQVLYVVFKEKSVVVPVQVTEESKKTTLKDGVRFAYTVRTEAGDAGKTFELDVEKHEAFTNAGTARTTLKERAARSVDRIIDRAVAVSKQRFPDADTASELLSDDQDVSLPHTADDDAQMIIQLPDGKVAKARIRQPSA